MKKLVLRIEELKVDSYPVPAKDEPQGTVVAYETTVYEGCTGKFCTQYISCNAFTC